VASRALDEGGTQELNLAQQYRETADRLRANWPRRSAVLRRVADTYETEAHREETEAERRRRGVGR
jgi:hypothetical protein